MKKILLTALVCLFYTTNQAQDISDALLYAQSDLNGTARFRAMGGAFGAIGGDLSAINVNPAGSAIFNNNLVGVTLTNYNVDNKSNFYGTKTSTTNNGFDLNQGGAVFVFQNNNESSGWKKLSLSANYDSSRNFDNSLYSAGVNQNSVANYFTSYANGENLSVISGNQVGVEYMSYGQQQAYFGYQGFIINPATNTDNNTDYYSNVAPGGNYFQENSTETSGYNSKLSFNAAGQYGEKLFVGVNLNSHFTDLRKSTSFYESNDNTSGTIAIDRLRFNNELYTYGQGFSFQLGAIYKATKQFRVGLAYESPTWYNLNDEVSQNLISVRSSSSGDLPASVVNPQLTNIFEPYKLQTPGKYTGSLAYVFGKRGLLSVDYSMKDYSNTKYRPADQYFTPTNSLMSNLLDTSREIRIGGEYKIERLSLRGGYRWEESPYKNQTTVGDLTGYSGGIGYNFGDTKLDLSYSRAKRLYDSAFFSQGLTDYARIESVMSNVSLTVLFEL